MPLEKKKKEKEEKEKIGRKSVGVSGHVLKLASDFLIKKNPVACRFCRLPKPVESGGVSGHVP